MTGLGIDVLGGGSLLLVTLAVLAFFRNCPGGAIGHRLDRGLGA